MLKNKCMKFEWNWVSSLTIGSLTDVSVSGMCLWLSDAYCGRIRDRQHACKEAGYLLSKSSLLSKHCSYQTLITSAPVRTNHLRPKLQTHSIHPPALHLPPHSQP